MAILGPAIAEKLGVSFSFVGRYVSRLFDAFNIDIVILPEKKSTFWFLIIEIFF